MVTLREVAEAAGVSINTASRALNGTTKEVWPTIAARAERIRGVAERMGFRPNAAARSMRTQRTQQVGVLLRNSAAERFFYPPAFEFLHGINSGLEREDHSLVLVRVDELRGQAEPRVFREHVLDGVIVIGTHAGDVVARLEQQVERIVWLDSDRWEAQRCVRRDEREAGARAAEALIAAGCERVLWFGPEPREGAHFSEVDRRAGAREAARAARRAFAALGELPRDPTAAAALRDRVRDGDGVGVVAYDLRHAEWLAHALEASGARLGSDVRLACCDGTSASADSWPTLSRMHYDRFAAGERAAELLLGTLRRRRARAPSETVHGRWEAGTTAGGGAR